ncbi:MAG: cell division protein FtsZ [Deltaproteobacteria bacterium]|uniref:Cell division protein FtsZ n=1 Tax=Candidatus Zymogenus saltonus TaxID=2844893 RepID=A0A9D8PQV5_9DELT|nr:cell division protein FtsZ [Candidatus Zymogenus saltonus]
MFELMENLQGGARIKVIGIGGGGGNAVDNMVQMGLIGVDFICANTDSQALNASVAPLKLQIGSKLTRGLGTGADPEIGRKAAEEDREKIRKALAGANMVFITAGMGGGTGTGGAPVCAEVAREVGALSVAVVTKPFHFENKKRMKQAEAGIEELEQYVDTLICIPNQRLLEITGRQETLITAFKRADEILYCAVRGISDLINIRGLINLDFSDVKTIMEETGMAIMGTGKAEGKEKGVEAAKRAVTSPLLENISISGARGVLVNLTGGEDLSMEDVEGAMSFIQGEAHEDANIIFGAVIDNKMKEEFMVTVIATGFAKGERRLSRELVRIAPLNTSIAEEKGLDTPTFIRKEREELALQKVTRGVRVPNDEDSEYDIPTFMRKKAD